MTEPLDTAAIRARLSAATPGPWTRSVKTWDGEEIQIVTAGLAEIAQEPTTFNAYPSGAFIETDGIEANLELIAHAPTDIAALCDEVVLLREERDEAFRILSGPAPLHRRTQVVPLARQMVDNLNRALAEIDRLRAERDAALSEVGRLMAIGLREDVR